MEKVKTIIVFDLWNDALSVSLNLQYGRVMDENGNTITSNSAQRWRFYGCRIPMPVRSGTWFQGLSTSEMLAWLRSNGWELRGRVNLCTGGIYIYPRCKGNETPIEEDDAPVNEETVKRNEETSDEEYANAADERSFREVLVYLYNHSMRVKAIRLYRYVKKCGITDAYNAIREMVALDEESGIC